MDEIDIDDERHRREEAERRARRHRTREEREQRGEGGKRGGSGGGVGDDQAPPSSSRHLSEKERKRREHAARILGAQQGQQQKKGGRPPPPPPHSRGKSPSSSSSSAPKSPSTPSTPGGGASVFQSLFAERAEGFFVDLRFRNAPPRPPVGPIFVGSGLEGELTSKWTKYKARNAVESRYAWRLHPGDHLRELVSRLATGAMDIEGCYRGEKSGKDSKEGGGGSGSGGKAVAPSSAQQRGVVPATAEPPHPEDEALIDWGGSMGDTSAEALQQGRDRARAAARSAIARGHGARLVPASSGGATAAGATAAAGGGGAGKPFKLKKSHHVQSRVLDERTPNFMKKTTYLTNDATSVHRFTSLATRQGQMARDVDMAVAETRNRRAGADAIEMGFAEANDLEVMHPVVVEGGEGGGGESKGTGRVHPTRKDVHPVWDMPLLPDVRTWGHTFTHVVLDNPPRNAVADGRAKKKRTSPSSGGDDDGDLPGVGSLAGAIVADVSRQEHNARMECTVWVPATSSSSSSSPKPPAGKMSRRAAAERHRAIQKYDLDVVPLQDQSAPPVHYVFTIDPSSPPGSGGGGGRGGYVGYHPIRSRVQLSMGRPVVASDGGGGGSDVRRRDLDDEERRALEVRTAEVDVDLAEKHGLSIESDGEEEGRGQSRGNSRLGGGGGGEGRRKHIVKEESDGDNGEEDAF
jgi:RNA polymerase II-associated factor 1